jgi:tRNA (mo5U34)-methyltransferase
LEQGDAASDKILNDNRADLDDLQRRINAITWYHEFDFPNGLIARSKTPDVAAHHRVWSHIRQQLDRIDFRGKTVLDLGCWDGYWSFYAEQRGAKRVLATDDASQNWAGSSGLLLAKELLGSKIETRMDVSVYDLKKLGETFDIVLCLGIYYHLIDPFFAFAQVRHCCHSESLAVFEGDGFHSWRQQYLRFDLSDSAIPLFVPTRDALSQMLRAAYFDIKSESTLQSWGRRQLMAILDAVKCIAPFVPVTTDRFFTVCRAVKSKNQFHHYPPPFGLRAYDTRFE